VAKTAAHAKTWTAEGSRQHTARPLWGQQKKLPKGDFAEFAVTQTHTE